MHTGTGEIVDFEKVKKLMEQKSLAANFYKLIPQEYEEELKGMNRKQRRTWYSQNKHKFQPPSSQEQSRGKQRKGE